MDKRLKLNDSKTEMDRKQKQIYNGNLIWIFIISFMDLKYYLFIYLFINILYE